MRRRQACPHHELDDEVAVAHTIQRILRDRREAEILPKELAIDNERVARKRTRTKWKD